jgi:hypothetical protein
MRIRYIFDVPGWTALYASPVHPFYVMRPVAFLGSIDRGRSVDGVPVGEEVVGFVAYAGFVPADDVGDGTVFITYLHSNLLLSQDAADVQHKSDLISFAVGYGRQLAEMYERQAHEGRGTSWVGEPAAAGSHGVDVQPDDSG